mmetsp:Transcript_59703/g.69784  ORF Transcript_59703/g.69784 Transcript_59703/m.69784 type:complete len:83 (+) Transcript_59703:3003-3251(+)
MMALQENPRDLTNRAGHDRKVKVADHLRGADDPEVRAEAKVGCMIAIVTTTQVVLTISKWVRWIPHNTSWFSRSVFSFLVRV